LRGYGLLPDRVPGTCWQLGGEVFSRLENLAMRCSGAGKRRSDSVFRDHDTECSNISDVTGNWWSGN